MSPARRACIVRATDLLGHVDTEEEALEYCAAIMQMYREEAAYLDRLCKWVEKTGLERARSDHGGPDNRKGLYERFMLSQRVRAAIPGPNAPPARTCTNSCRSRCVAACAHRRRMSEDSMEEPTYWFDVGPVTAIPLRGARTVRTPRREIAVFRTASERDFRAGKQMPAQGRPVERRHRPRPQGRVSAAQLDHRSRKRRGDRRRPGRAREFPVKIDAGPHLSSTMRPSIRSPRDGQWESKRPHPEESTRCVGVPKDDRRAGASGAR